MGPERTFQKRRKHSPCQGTSQQVELTEQRELGVGPAVGKGMGALHGGLPGPAEQPGWQAELRVHGRMSDRGQGGVAVRDGHPECGDRCTRGAVAPLHSLTLLS